MNKQIIAELDQLVGHGAMSSKYQSLLRHFYEEVRDALTQATGLCSLSIDQFAQFLHLVEAANPNSLSLPSLS